MRRECDAGDLRGGLVFRLGQGDAIGELHRHPAIADAHLDFAARVRQYSVKLHDATKLRTDRDLVESEGGWADACQRGIVVVEWVGAPSVAVASSRLGCFDRCFQPPLS